MSLPWTMFLSSPGRGDPLPARAIRFGKVHAVAHRRGYHPACTRTHHDRGRRGRGPRRECRAGEATRRHGLPGLRAFSPPDALPRTWRSASGAGAAPRPTAPSARCWIASVSRFTPIAIRTCCRAANASVSRSRARLRRTRSVLLMDEPFSSLDDRLRDRVRRETIGLLRDTRTTDDHRHPRPGRSGQRRRSDCAAAARASAAVRLGRKICTRIRHRRSPRSSSAMSTS